MSGFGARSVGSYGVRGSVVFGSDLFLLLLVCFIIGCLIGLLIVWWPEFRR
jgi:hypothetical protein